MARDRARSRSRKLLFPHSLGQQRTPSAQSSIRRSRCRLPADFTSMTSPASAVLLEIGRGCLHALEGAEFSALHIFRQRSDFVRGRADKDDFIGHVPGRAICVSIFADWVAAIVADVAQHKPLARGGYGSQRLERQQNAVVGRLACPGERSDRPQSCERSSASAPAQSWRPGRQSFAGETPISSAHVTAAETASQLWAPISCVSRSMLLIAVAERQRPASPCRRCPHVRDLVVGRPPIQTG